MFLNGFCSGYVKSFINVYGLFLLWFELYGMVVVGKKWDITYLCFKEKIVRLDIFLYVDLYLYTACFLESAGIWSLFKYEEKKIWYNEEFIF